MKRHILTPYGLTLCCLRIPETVNEEILCSQCHHVAVMIFKGHPEFLKQVKEKSLTRVPKAYN